MKSTFLIYLLVVLFCSTSLRGQHTASQNVSTFEIEATQLDTIKKIWVYLPQTYAVSQKKYPVIYMHDAQNLFDTKTSYVGEWKIDETLDSLKAPEAIIVGIEHGGKHRIDELTPFPNEKYGGGKADKYLDFIVRTLKPHVDSTYRSLTDAEHTGIFGSSLGGLVSFYGLLKYPKTFGFAGIYSPSFWFSEKIYDFAKDSEIPSSAKFLFLVGTEESDEMVPDMERMIELLKSKGVEPHNLNTYYIEGGKHNEALWSKHFPESYLWLMN